jgi:hypothetical protein
MAAEAPVKGSPDWTELFAAYRVDSVHGGEVITGRLHEGLEPASERVRGFLAGWSGFHDLRLAPDGWHLILYRSTAGPRERWWLHGLLLALTVFSTVLAGALLSGLNPIEFVALPLFEGWWVPVPAELDPSALAVGLPFGLTLVAILALHESGHYVAARRHAIRVTPPFFIPFPPYLSIIGTLGAFIRLRSPVTNRRSLLDVGVAGPLASFVASLPVLWWGLLHSRVVQAPPGIPGEFVVRFMGQEIWLGGSLAFSGLTRVLLGFGGEGVVLLLHPVAFAGWIGLFVTALNLLPISQLDGGHILYAMASEAQRPLAWLFFGALIPLGYLWVGWWVWAAMVFLVGRGRLRHPPVFNTESRLDRRRLAIGILSMIIFVICFVPVPFEL